jgi:hypothetical protein
LNTVELLKIHDVIDSAIYRSLKDHATISAYYGINSYTRMSFWKRVLVDIHEIEQRYTMTSRADNVLRIIEDYVTTLKLERAELSRLLRKHNELVEMREIRATHTGRLSASEDHTSNTPKGDIQ